MPHHLDRDLLFLLADVGRLVRTHADRQAREGGMTRAQWAILARLERQDGLTQKDLAALLEVEPITVARLLDRLQARGLVERRADPADRRVWRLYLTPAASVVLRQIADYRAALHEEITAGLEPAVVEGVVEALLRMKANLLAGIRTLSSLLALGLLDVHESCTDLLLEIPAYCWDDKAAERGEDRPLKVADHGVDATRYAVQSTRGMWRQALGHQLYELAA